MLFKVLVVLLSGGGVAASALLPRNECQMDNCLRALNSTSPRTRLAEAKQDCSSYLVTTSTPPPQTSTEYTTLTATETVVDEVTKTNTIHGTVTKTVTEPIIKTVHVQGDTTTTVTVTLLTASVGIGKRQAQPALPTYASACSGTVRYSSACSCIGVTGQTVTATAVTTTVTAPTTTYTTAHQTSTVATTDVVVYDTTVTKTVTTYSTTTVTDVATATATAFKIGLDVQGRVPGFLNKLDVGILGLASYTTDISAAVTVVLQPDGSLWCDDKVAKADLLGSLLPLVFVNAGLSLERKPVKCSLDAHRVLTCTAPDAPGKTRVFGVEVTTGIVLFGWLENLLPFLHQKTTCKALPLA
ncbi:hypothetical protein HJFPF1_01754 [Paramyrothecium foliicola]|nr:hypothetical protein HJFPF1_01754 [Paramyrothecium foliicola]